MWQSWHIGYLEIVSWLANTYSLAVTTNVRRSWKFQRATACGHRITHRKWKETKLHPGTAGPGNRLGFCIVSFHFLWAILCPQAVQRGINKHLKYTYEFWGNCDMTHLIICTLIFTKILVMFGHCWNHTNLIVPPSRCHRGNSISFLRRLLVRAPRSLANSIKGKSWVGPRESSVRRRIEGWPR